MTVTLIEFVGGALLIYVAIRCIALLPLILHGQAQKGTHCTGSLFAILLLLAAMLVGAVTGYGSIFWGLIDFIAGLLGLAGLAAFAKNKGKGGKAQPKPKPPAKTSPAPQPPPPSLIPTPTPAPGGGIGIGGALKI